MSAGRILGPAAVVKVAQAVRAIGRAPSNRAIADRRIPKTPAIRPSCLAITTTTIGPRTGTSPNFALGSGSATLLWVKTPTATSATTEASPTAATVYNTTTQSIGSGVLVQLKRCDGIYIIDVAECPT